MNIGIFTSSFPLRLHDPAAAAGLFVRDFAIAVAELGHRVHVLTQDKGQGCDHPPPGVTVTCFPWRGAERPASSLKLHRPADLAAAWSMIRTGRAAATDLHTNFALDHVLAMWAVPAGVFAAQLHRTAGVDYSVWCLGTDIWTYGKIAGVRRIVAGILKKSSRCYADGIQLAKDAERLAGRTVEFLPSSRKISPGAGVAVDGVAAGSRDQDKAPRFLFIGRYAPVKGPDVLLEAMALFADRHPSAVLRMFGGGPLESQLRQRAEQGDLGGRVEVGSLADLSTVVSEMQKCDAVIIPSRMESIPVVLSDVLQMGKPVIVTDVGDMGCLVREVPAGIVVPPDDPPALCAAMQQFAAQPPGVYRAQIQQLAVRFDIHQAAARFVADISQ